MQITPNSPIRRPIIRFLLAVRRKKGSAPVISTDFHPVQRLPSLDLSLPPLPMVLCLLEDETWPVTDRPRYRRLESGISSSGDPLIAVSIFVHTKGLLKRSTASERDSSRLLSIQGQGRGEETRGVHTERNPSPKCIEEIVCDPGSGFSATYKVTFRIGRPLSMRSTPLWRIPHQRNRRSSWRDSRGTRGVYKFGDNVWGGDSVSRRKYGCFN